MAQAAEGSSGVPFLAGFQSLKAVVLKAMVRWCLAVLGLFCNAVAAV